MTFTVRTVPAGGNFAPKHVLAIWVESNNTFVKTRKAMAGIRKQYLYTWAAASNFNTVDAITGATLNNHQTHTVTWDCTDLNGDIVPDGDYVVYTEFTDQHAQGPLYSITFTKGPDPQTLIMPDETYFKDIELTFVPVVSDFTVNTTEACQDDEITFTDASVNATSWEWDFGEGAMPATANSQGPHNVSYSTPGLKTVSLTVNGSVTDIREDYINVAVKPIAGFEYGGNGLTVEFMNNSTFADTYLWDFGDGNTSMEENPIHTYAVAGTYQVSLQSSLADCMDEAMQEINVPLVGLDEQSLETSISIYPNPCTSIAYLRLPPSAFRFPNVDVYGIDGRIIQKILGQEVLPGENEIELDLNNLPSGMYYIRVSDATGRVAISKLLKY